MSLGKTERREAMQAWTAAAADEEEEGASVEAPEAGAAAAAGTAAGAADAAAAIAAGGAGDQPLSVHTRERRPYICLGSGGRLVVEKRCVVCAAEWEEDHGGRCLRNEGTRRRERQEDG